MSIADEIRVLKTNLNAAKTAVVSKGGKIGDTGLTGLATEISTIPSGEAEDWGTVTFTDEDSQSVTVRMHSMGDFMQLASSDQGRTIEIDGESFAVSNITEVVLGGSVTAIPEYFLWQASSLTSLSMSSVAYIGGSFLYGCSSFNAPLDVSSVIFVGKRFMNYCSSFNQVLDFSALTRIDSDFLARCTAFNKTINILMVRKIGNGFMYYCSSFNQLIDISSVKEMGNSFMEGCKSFNQPISLQPGMRIGNGFLQFCERFNQPVSLYSDMTIGSYFLKGCSAFDQPVAIPEGFTEVPAGLLAECSNFNRPLSIPSTAVAIGAEFLKNCPSFNQSLDTSNISVFGTYVLSGCSSFNQALDLTAATSIGQNFLSLCTSFNQPITIPASLNVFGKSVLMYCDSMISVITIEAPATVVTTASDYNSFSAQTSSAPSYATGMTFGGTYATDWKAKFRDNTAKPFRKILVA